MAKAPAGADTGCAYIRVNAVSGITSGNGGIDYDSAKAWLDFMMTMAYALWHGVFPAKMRCFIDSAGLR